MIKIIEVLPDPHDGTSWFRGRLPNAMLEHSSGTKTVFIPVNPNIELGWAELVKCNILFMQRPVSDVAVNTVINARRLNKPIWVDYDDLLTEVPIDNSTYEQFNGARKNIGFILDNASVITVSTQHLADRLRLVGGINYVVVPNGWADITGIGMGVSDKTNAIMWRGSIHHQADLMSVRDVLKEQAKVNKMDVIMVGHKPWFYDFKVDYVPYNSLLEYYAYLGSRPARLCIVPLVDNHFNRSKSNNAFMEANYAGACVIAPNYNEWIRPGVINYGDVSELNDIIKALANDPQKTQELWQKSKEYIVSNLLLSYVNKKREAIITSLYHNSLL